MAQHDYVISNQGFASYRSDHNSSLSAIVSNNSGATAPSTTYAYQWWYDETTDILKMRNADNDAWITMFTFDQTADTYSLATDVELTITENLDLTGSATISGDLTVDTDTLYVDTTNNRVGVKNASPTVELDVTGEAKISGDLTVDTDTLYVDSTNNRVGVGTTSPSATLDVTSSDLDAVFLRSSNSTTTNVFITNTNATTGNTANLYLAPANNVAGSQISSIAIEDFSVSANRTADLAFSTRLNGTFNERMRIGSGGGVAIGSTTTTVAKLRVDTFDANEDILRTNGINGSYTEIVQFDNVTRSATANYSFLGCYSGDVADLEFNLRGDGNAFCDGSFSGGGADYAEYFEWSDGNTDNEDRRGYTVVLNGNMIRKATDTDNASEIIGVISSDPVVVGDASWNKWTNKHLKDDFGSYISEEHNVVEWVEQELVEEAQSEVYDEEGNVVEEAKEAVYREKKHSYEDWNIPEGIIVPDDAEIKTHDDKGNRFQHRKVNPDYDPNIEYIPREQRKEWDAVGLMGKLRIRKGQPVGDRWIKMRDISDTVEEWLIR